MFSLPGLPRLPLVVGVYNAYDVFEEQSGRRDEWAVRSIAVRGAGVDLRVLSLELPADIIERLGLCPDPERANQDPTPTRRLSPVRLLIRGRFATVAPYRGASDNVVVGHTALLALGLALDAGGDLIDDPFPARWGPPLDVF